MEFLHFDLCEVEVFEGSPPVNIAKYGIATQESSSYGGVATLAIDGKTYGSNTHTKRRQECLTNQEAWWKLEFSTDVQIDSIRIWNKMQGGVSNRIDDAKILLDNKLCGTIKYKEGTNPYNINCGSVVARNITIRSGVNHGCILSLCEVEVFSTNPPDVCSDSVENGAMYPAEVIEGSPISVTCDKGFRTEGNWELVCRNGSLGDRSSERFPRCVPIKTDQDCQVKADNGFLKSVCQDSSRKTFKCPYSATLYEIIDMQPDGATFSDICENDEQFYQSCVDRSNVLTSTDRLVCGHYICNNSSNEEIKSSRCRNTGKLDSCSNLVSTQYQVCLESKEEKSKKCDYVCHELDCRDEAQCNGVTYGEFCQNDFYFSILRLGLADVQNQYQRCSMAYYLWESTEFLKTYTGHVCQHSVSGLTVPILDFTRCAAFRYDPFLVTDTEIWWVTEPMTPYCTNMMEQTNCTDPSKVAISCMVNGYRTDISLLAMCHGKSDVQICDDGMENNCKDLSPSCLVHKHKICDGIIDCIDQSDEKNIDCQTMTNETCVRVLGNESLPIPLAWLGDGIVDCVSSIDETPIWPTCGSGKTQRYVINNDSCTDDFLGLNSETKYIPLTLMCDMINTCGNENEICKLSRDITDLPSTVDKNENGAENLVPYCMKGLETLQRLSNNCTRINFRYPPENTFGKNNSKTIRMPEKPVNCDFTFGEMYIYTSCTGQCLASECPLSRPIRYDSCSGQYPNRIFTIYNMDYLIFVTPSRETYKNDYFLCRNNRCVTYDKVCDLVDDCWDGSDEETCTNQFHCNSSNTRIPIWQQCDGQINCQDSSDECNDGCGKEIIDGIPLKISSWIIGSLAVVFNTAIISISLKDLRSIKSSVGLLNKLLIIFISIGDLLVGGYLFAISIIDNSYGASYCSKQTQWLSSHSCSILGIVSTIGSQLSLFSMTCLSLARFFGIKNAMNISGSFSWKAKTKVIALLILIFMVSVGIAVSPIVPQFEDFFVNGISYDSKNPMFVGFPDKKVHGQVIEAYYGRTKGDPSSMSWKIILELVDKMFSNQYGGLQRRKVDFYGNDGVCLFKYFVTDKDPQKVFAWSILAVNFFCFLIIVLSYLYINLVSVQSARSMKNNEQVNERNRRMQRKISIIIATDFCCWIPFVLISCLHSLSVLDATSWYSLFSIVILPINSVINPLLYDDTVSKYIFRPAESFHRSFRNVTSTFSFNATSIILTRSRNKRTNRGDTAQISRRNCTTEL